MSPPDRTKGLARVDPLFGEVRYDGKGTWAGSAEIAPIADTVAVLIATDEGGPTDAHRETFRELVRRYAALSPDIAAALYALFAPYEKESDAGRLPRPASADEMWRIVSLDWVHIEDGERLRLGYGFVEGAGWDDAMFTVSVENWVATGESLDD